MDAASQGRHPRCVHASWTSRWIRYSRWTQTSLHEAAAHEAGLLSLLQGCGAASRVAHHVAQCTASPWAPQRHLLCRHKLSAVNVRVGPGKQDWLHTLTNCPLPSSSVFHQPQTSVCKMTAKNSHSYGPTPVQPNQPAAVKPVAGGLPFVFMPGYGAGAGFFFRCVRLVWVRL